MFNVRECHKITTERKTRVVWLAEATRPTTIANELSLPGTTYNAAMLPAHRHHLQV
jgi:hypothetical protein